MLKATIAGRASFLLFVSLVAASCGESPTLAPMVPDEPQLAKTPAPGLIVTPATTTIHIGTSQVLTVTNANGSAVTKQATWKSSDTTIATVVSTGRATAAVIAKKPGTVTVTATVQNKSGTNTTTVLPIPVRFVTISPDSARIQIGQQLQYVAVTRDSAGNVLTGRTVTWSVMQPSIASLSSSGLASGLAVGSTRVIAMSEGVADTTWLTVEQIPARLELVEKTLIFDALGETKTLVARVYDANENLIPNAIVTWASDSTDVVTVDASGVVTPRFTGHQAWTFVHASLGTLADTAVTLVYRHPTSVVASPDTMFINELPDMGEISGQFTGVMYDRNGYPIEGASMLYESLDMAVASVSIDGSVVAHSNGTARIVAFSFSGAHDTVYVVVNAPAPAPSQPSDSARFAPDAADWIPNALLAAKKE